MPSDDDGKRPSPLSRVKQESEDSATALSDATQSSKKQYRSLLPRPPPTVISLPSRSRKPPATVATAKRLKLCGVPQCRRLPCTLVTHRLYAKALRNAQRPQSPARELSNLLKYATSQAGSRQLSAQASLRTTPAPELQRGDSLPELRFEHQYPSEIRQLFHVFANDYFYRMILRFLPPIDVASYRNKALDTACSDEAVFLSLMAHTKFDIMMRRDQRETDQVCGMIYSRVTQNLRKRLDGLHDPDIDALLLFVVALSNFDVIGTRTDTLQTHREGIKHLVSARGGVHNLGWSLPYILNADRRLAVFSGSYPLLSQPNRHMLHLPARPPGRYGSTFYSPLSSQLLESDVLEFCRDQCRLIDLMERSRVSFDADRPSHGVPNLIPYFFFARDQVNAEFAWLHAKHVETKERDFCVLVAAQIVGYPIAYGNYMPIMTSFLADELSDALKKQDLPRTWSACPEILAWILFVLTTVSVSWLGRTWAEQALKSHLTIRYGTGTWPGVWAQQQWQILNSLVWSEQFLQPPFESLCDRLNE